LGKFFRVIFSVFG